MKINKYCKQLCRSLMACILLAGFLPVISLSPAQGQTITKIDKDRGKMMLNVIKDDLKKNYYDNKYHGMDIETRFNIAEGKIDEVQSIGQIFGIIAQVLLDLNDSHAFFIPPQRSDRAEYGIQMQMIGDKCYVVAVKPGSDAEAKGIKVGDLVHSVSGFKPSRDLMWKIKYLFYSLRPQPGLRIALQSPGAEPRHLDTMAKIVRGQVILNLTNTVNISQAIREAEEEDKLNRHRYIEMGTDAFIWKMPGFDLTEQDIDVMLDKVKKHKALILDLRGNGGGAEETLKRLVANVFDKEVKIADLEGRKEMKPVLAKPRSEKPYSGKIIVLIDSESGSAAELFARIMQLEKRGTVIGDRSAGAVMRSRIYSHQTGLDTIVLYAASITEANVIMADGKSLEKVGVTPDEGMLPTAEDLAAKRDPVLTRAAELAGIKLDAEKAGKMFPIEWKK
jgi:C-terminal processing protease CtpA/Prc